MSADESSQAAAQSEDSSYGTYLSRLLSDRERFFTEVVEGRNLGGLIARGLLTLVAFCALYGAAAGAYAGAVQSLSSAIKLPLLFVGTLVICFPGFFVIEVLVGSRLRLSQVLALVTGALALSAVLLAAVVPVTVFFLLTAANYYFLELLHTAIVLGAGLVGMAALHEGLAFACEKRGVYPRSAMTIMRVWAVLFAFVGVQMAWSLRPFVGDRGVPFKVFRRYEGNFYTAVVYSIRQLAEGRDKRAPAPHAPVRLPGGYRIEHPWRADSARAGRP